MFFLTPRYLKRAKQLHKGVTRFINYKSDLLPAAKLEEIRGLRRNLEQAMKARDKARIESLYQEINKVCERALPDAATSEIADNVEVFFVAIVIALGIRAYIAQPFKIPTGSMQPTLNGNIAEHTDADPRPSLPRRALGFLAGRSYFNVESNHDGRLRRQDPITEHNFLVWSFCKVHFEDGHTIRISAPFRQLVEPEGLGLSRYLGLSLMHDSSVRTPDGKPHYRIVGEPPLVREGQLMARGIMDTGDHVLVNKFAYHFRRPARGEVFVFTTKHIRGIQVPEEQGSQHYIKRLGGVPGDKLEVQSPKLLINGTEAREPGFQRVMQGTFDTPVDGYRGYADARSVHGSINQIDLGAEQYFALGDNSYNSSDSRVWGIVPERNLVGPALLCYLPFGSHWGAIK
jgi:signal peptidase I